jgi:hypothetical protein
MTRQAGSYVVNKGRAQATNSTLAGINLMALRQTLSRAKRA